MTKQVPARIYRCPFCGYDSERRYVLRNHLMNVHGVLKRDAGQIAMANEYWLNPHYIRRADIEDDEE